MALLGKLGVPVDCTLWDSELAAQVHVTVPPARIVSTAGFDVPLCTLVNTIPGPTVTAALIGSVTAVPWNVTGEPASPGLGPVRGFGPAGPPRVTVARALAAPSPGAPAGRHLAAPEPPCPL